MVRTYKNQKNSWKTLESLDNNAKRHAKIWLEREKAIPPQLPPELVSFPLLPPLPLLPLFPLHLRDPKDLNTIKFTSSAVLSGLENKSISVHLNIHHHQLFHHVEGMHQALSTIYHVIKLTESKVQTIPTFCWLRRRDSMQLLVAQTNRCDPYQLPIPPIAADPPS